MQQGIHPKYEAIQVQCSCGHKFDVRSTLGEDLHLDVCAKCHPFYTGHQKIIDTAGRIDSFKQKYAFLSSKTATKNSGDSKDKASS